MYCDGVCYCGRVVSSASTAQACRDGGAVNSGANRQEVIKSISNQAGSDVWGL